MLSLITFIVFVFIWFYLVETTTTNSQHEMKLKYLGLFGSIFILCALIVFFNVTRYRVVNVTQGKYIINPMSFNQVETYFLASAEGLQVYKGGKITTLSWENTEICYVGDDVEQGLHIVNTYIVFPDNKWNPINWGRYKTKTTNRVFIRVSGLSAYSLAQTTDNKQVTEEDFNDRP